MTSEARLSRQRAADLAAVVATAALAWGVFTFGAVYPWAYWPLGAAASLLGILGWIAGGASIRRELRLPALAMAGFVALVCVQLVPLRLAAIAGVSPASIDLLARLEPAVAAGLVDRHPLSIHPTQTLTAGVLFACWSAAAIGTAALFSRTGSTRLVQQLTVTGALVALVGIVQAPFFTGRIYGFWQPYAPGSSFGPFVNRNHFAGWMLMAIPVTAGLVFGTVARHSERAPGGVRQRLSWVTGADANRILILAGGVVSMALALFVSMSRSGILALIIAAVMLSLVATRRQRSWPRRLATLAAPAVAVGLLVWWVGPGRLETRFSHDSGSAGARLGAWTDAWSVARAFPLTGTGLNTYDVAMLFYQRHDLAHLYEQAHNDYLQLAAEGGALLCVPAAIAVLAAARVARRRFTEPSTARAYWIRLGAACGILAIAIQELFDFSLQMPGNALLFAVLCGIVLHRAPVDTGRTADWRPRS